MTDGEFHLTRDVLDAHAARLDDFTGCVADLEIKATEQAKQLVAYRL